MTRDVGESYSVSQSHPEVTREMQKRLQQARAAYAPYKKGMPPFFKKLIQEMLKQHQQD